jgi:hypothetical protein
MRKYVPAVHAKRKKQISVVLVASIYKINIQLAINVMKDVRIHEKK